MKIELFNGSFCRKTAMLVCLLLLSGCIFAPKHEVATYDLGLPKSSPVKNVNLTIVPFLNNSETSFQMLYRVNNYKIEYDSYNRWSNNPGKLLTFYLKNTFLNDFDTYSTSVNNYTLSGSVVAFEINLQDNYVILSINYSLNKNKVNILKQSKTYKKYFKNPSPAVFASSMASAVDEFVNDLTSELQTNKIGQNDYIFYPTINKNNPFNSIKL
jgi:ABC-type uncharacterized transport system auxiliary subunit